MPFLSLARSIGSGILAENPQSQVVMGARHAAMARQRRVPPVCHPTSSSGLRSPATSRSPGRPGPIRPAMTARSYAPRLRAVATDPLARARFRRYWSLASPGIILIRWLMLNPVKTAAERRARELR
jgi:hypothetical protein